MKKRIRYLPLLFLIAISVSSYSHAQSLKRQSIGSLGSSNLKSGELYLHMTVGQVNQATSADRSIRIGFEQFTESVKREKTEQVKEAISINAYPNPTNSSLNLDLPESVEEGKLSIFNVSGSLVHEAKVIESQFIKLDVSALNEGIYYLSIIPNQSATSFVTKFIISK